VRRGGRSSRRFSRGKKDYIWATTRVDQPVLDDETLFITTLVAPSDWVASSTGFERATIVAIRGWLCVSQLASGTNNDGTILAMYIAKNASTAASAFSPLAASSYDTTDVMWCDGASMLASVAGDRSHPESVTRQLNVKAKRKIDSSEVLQLVSAMDIDTASPTALVSGIVRVLIERT